jgi:hypothetical protein
MAATTASHGLPSSILIDKKTPKEIASAKAVSVTSATLALIRISRSQLSMRPYLRNRRCSHDVPIIMHGKTVILFRDYLIWGTMKICFHRGGRWWVMGELRRVCARTR